MSLKSKVVRGELIEVRQHSDGGYGLYVNGSLKSQSADLSFILREYDKY